MTAAAPQLDLFGAMAPSCPRKEAPHALTEDAEHASAEIVPPSPRRVDGNPCAALGYLANAARSNGETHAPGCHVSRAAEMVKRGRVGAALFYLRTLARNELATARLLAAHNRAASNQVAIACHRERASVYLAALGVVKPLGATEWHRRPVAETREAGSLEVFRTDLDSCMMLAGYAHKVTNPSHPELCGHGVFVEVSSYQKRRIRVEMFVGFPDRERTQYVQARMVHGDLDEALDVARAYIDLGETLLAATLTSPEAA